MINYSFIPNNIMFTIGQSLNKALLSAGLSPGDAKKGVVGAMNGIHGGGLKMVEGLDEMKIGENSSVQEKGMVKSNQGGYVFTISELSALIRLLVIGESNSIYQNDKDMLETIIQVVLPFILRDEKSGLTALSVCIKADSDRMVFRKKNLMLVLAILAKLGHTQKVRQATYGAVLDLVRTLDHMAMFVTFYELAGFGMKRPDGSDVGTGWGRGFKSCMNAWFNSKEPSRLLYLFSKYKNRNGWSFRDLLRLTKPKPFSDDHNRAFSFACEKEVSVSPTSSFNEQIEAIKLANNCGNLKDLGDILDKYGYKVAREHFPNELWAIPGSWNRIFLNMPGTACLRNVNKVDFSDRSTGEVCIQKIQNLLGSPDVISKARLNPVNLLVTAKTYSSGSGVKSKSTWEVNKRVAKILDDSVEKSMKSCNWIMERVHFALDVSGSMSATFGDTPVSCATMTAVIARLALLKDPTVPVYAFSDEYIDLKAGCKSGYSYSTGTKGYIRNAKDWNDLERRISGLNFGGTNPSLAILHAIKEFNKNPYHHEKIKAFIVITDNDVGQHYNSKTHSALYEYRKLVKDETVMLIVIGLTANTFTIAPPDDPYCLDIAGFEPNLFDTLTTFINSNGGLGIMDSLDHDIGNKMQKKYMEARSKYVK